jgi:eukaryotic-like serine/threonine-protein kinase
MKEARAKTVESIFHDALAKPEADREKFLAEACQGDADLQREVASLLSAYKSSGGLLDSGVLAFLQQEPEPPPVFQEGDHITTYRIVRLLGKGGMGEVYEAYDERLHRKVALKTLPQVLSRDAQRVERLKREARAASALNHPNILTIYDFGQANDIQYIVSELVEGRSLRELIGQISVATALDYARQIGEALEAAHRAGIVHRDIKPENVMVRSDGYVKVLDFGLAKVRLLPSSGQSLDEQLSQTGLISVPGLIMGTCNYMSPEQVRGLEVDWRTDLWSWGVVLYEMLAAHRPFDGTTVSDTLASILQQEPAPPGDDPDLNRIVARALSKPVAARYQSVREALQELQDDRKTSGSGLAQDSRKVQPRPPRRFRWILAWVFAAVVAMACATIYWRHVSASRQPLRIEGMVPLITSGNVTLGAISPDGSYAAYVTEDRRGQALKLAQVGTSGETERLPPAAGEYIGLTFSPDEHFIYYVFEQNLKGKLYRLALLGDDPRLVADDVDSAVSFSPDGSHIVFKRDDTAHHESALVIRSLENGQEVVLMQMHYPDAFYSGPLWTRDGDSVLCGTYNTSDEAKPSTKFVSIRIRDKTVTEIGPISWRYIYRPAWIRDGHGIVVAANSIQSNRSQLMDVSWPDGKVTAILRDTEDYRDLDATADSSKIVGVVVRREASLWVDAIADPDRPQLLAQGRYFGATWTKSNTVITRTDTGGHPDLWSIDAKTAKRRVITDDRYTKESAVVTPDDQYVVYTSNRDGSPHLWRSNLDGSHPLRLTSGASFDYQATVTPDSKWIIYTSNRNGFWALWKSSIDGGEPRLLPSGIAEQPEVNPLDENLIACNHSGFPLAWRAVILRADTGQVVNSFPAIPGEARLRWSADGKSLFFVVTTGDVSNVWMQPVDGGPATQLTHFTEETIFVVSPSPNGKSLAMIRGSKTSNLVLLEAAKQQ